MLRRLLGGDLGWGGAAGTLLLLGAGLALLWVSVAELQTALRHARARDPVAVTAAAPARPPLEALLGLGVGIGAIALGVRPVFRRWLLDRETAALRAAPDRDEEPPSA